MAVESARHPTQQDGSPAPTGRCRGGMRRASVKAFGGIEDDPQVDFHSGPWSRLPTNRINLNFQELRLLSSFRSLPGEERRKSVLEAIEMLVSFYD